MRDRRRRLKRGSWLGGSSLLRVDAEDLRANRPDTKRISSCSLKMPQRMACLIIPVRLEPKGAITLRRHCRGDCCRTGPHRIPVIAGSEGTRLCPGNGDRRPVESRTRWVLGQANGPDGGKLRRVMRPRRASPRRWRFCRPGRCRYTGRQGHVLRAPGRGRECTARRGAGKSNVCPAAGDRASRRLAAWGWPRRSLAEGG